MQSLNKKQLEIIISDVENARITFSHLADELVDHICCEVEQLISDGKSFDEAYEIVKQQTGIKVLQKIQENTHYLIDKNYRRMKMTMKITGNISLAILGMATVMKIFHWPFSSILLMLGFAVLCFIFFPSAIYTNYKEVKVKESKTLHLSVLIGGILFMVGVLFKVLHLAGAANLLLSGWLILLFIFLPILLYVKLHESNSIRDKSIVIVGILGLIIFELSTMFKIFHLKGAMMLMIVGSILLVTIFLPMFSYSKFKEVGRITGQYIFLLITTMFFILLSILLALNVSTTILDVYSNEGVNAAKIVSYLDQKNNKLYEDFKSKTDSLKSKYEQQVFAIQNNAKKVCELIDSIEIVLVMKSDKVDESTAKDHVKYINKIDGRVTTDNQLIMGEKNDGLACLLKQNLKRFKEVSQTATGLNQELSTSIEKLLNTSDVFIDKENQTWEQFTFQDKPIICSITFLKNIEMRVKMVESQAIQYINTIKK